MSHECTLIVQYTTFEVTSDAEFSLKRFSINFKLSHNITIDCMCCTDIIANISQQVPQFSNARPNICASCVTYLLPRMDPLLFQAALIDGAVVVKRLKMDRKSRTGIGTE